MADTVNFPSANTPEHVAFRLMNMILNNENNHNASREEILKTYVQCVLATKQGNYFPQDQI